MSLPSLTAVALLLNLVVITIVRKYRWDVFVLSAAATAQLAVLLCPHVVPKEYGTVVDVTHWIFGLTVALASLCSTHPLTLSYALVCLLGTLALRCHRRAGGAVPCPFDAEAPASSTIPNMGKYGADAFYAVFALVIVGRLSNRL